MIAQVSWQGTWAPPTLNPIDRTAFAMLVKDKGVNWVAVKLLPFPWHLIFASLGVAGIAALLAWPIGELC